MNYLQIRCLTTLRPDTGRSEEKNNAILAREIFANHRFIYF